MPGILYLGTIVQEYTGVITSTMCSYFSPESTNNTSQMDVAEHIRDSVVPAINGFQVDGVINREIIVSATDNPGGTVHLALTGNGAITAEDTLYSPPNLTLTVRWLVDTTQFGPRPTNIRYGFTRISGIPETGITNGRVNNAYFESLVTTLRNARTTPVVIGIDEFDPVVHVNPTSSGTNWKVAQILDTNGFKLGTQNTRKPRY